MAQARRKTKRAPARRRASRGARAALLLGTGLAVGVVLTALVLGYPVGPSWQLGSGLRSLVDRDSGAPEASGELPAGEGGEAGAERPHFDFYTVLPEIEYVIPEEPAPEPDDAGPARATPPLAPAGEPAAGAHYVLQAGSYADYGDADRMRAQLALSGLEAYVQRVSIEGRGVFFRVRLGPFDNRRELDAVNARLAREGIDALRIRVTRPASG